MKAFFIFVILTMVSVSVWASLDQNVIEGFKYLFANRWGIATLGDTYFGFLIIYLWMAQREKTWLARGIWLVLVLTLGTIAISTYLLREMARSPKGTLAS